MIRIWFDKGFSHSTYVFIIGIFPNREYAERCYNVLMKYYDARVKAWREGKKVLEYLFEHLPTEDIQRLIEKLKEIYKVDLYRGSKASEIVILENLILEDDPFEDPVTPLKYENIIIVWGYAGGCNTDKTFYGNVMKIFEAEKIDVVSESELPKYIYKLLTKNSYEVEEV